MAIIEHENAYVTTWHYIILFSMSTQTIIVKYQQTSIRKIPTLDNRQTFRLDLNCVKQPDFIFNCLFVY